MKNICDCGTLTGLSESLPNKPRDMCVRCYIDQMNLSRGVAAMTDVINQDASEGDPELDRELGIERPT